MAFNAKNLSYDKTEPAFLRRLKAGYASQDGRNNVQHARSGKSRLKMGDGDDDDPVILDESGQVVEKDIYEGMVNAESKAEDLKVEGAEVGKRKDHGSEGNDGDEGGKDGVGDRAQKVAEIGATKKRKAVKVVGGTDSNENQEIDKSLPRGEKLVSTVAGKTEKSSQEQKSKKKVKKIKLSFEEPE